MNRNERLALLAIVVLAIAIGGVAAYDFSSTGTPKNGVATNSFDQQPVVDVIVPSLFRQSTGGGVNEILNLTAGRSTNLTVQIYPTVAVSVSMQFRYFSLAGATTSNSESQIPSIEGYFSPPELTIPAEGEENCSLFLSISNRTAIGSYTFVISAVNLGNASQVWGVTLRANVAGPSG